MSMESIYEYGSRAGVWHILDLFRQRHVKVTVFAVAMAAARHPAVIETALATAMKLLHGYRWIRYQGMPIAEERAHMQQAIEH